MLMYKYEYECLCISEINDSNDTRNRREKLVTVVAIRFLHYPWNSAALFENGLGLVVSIHSKFLNNHYKSKNI